MTILSEFRKTTAHNFTQPAVRFLARLSITPSTLTWIGFLITIGAAVLASQGHLIIAGFVVLFAGFFDMLDGALARYTKQTSRFGALLDSTLDRLSDGALLIGILAFFAGEKSTTGILLAGIALLGSLTVSYIRAKGEEMGLECRIGLFTRPERVVVLALGLLLGHIDYALIIALAITAVLSFVTIGQRVIHLQKQIKSR